MIGKNPHYLPLLVFILLPFTIIITYIIAISLGHINPGLYYMSDIMVQEPEASICSQLLNFCSLLVGMTVYVRYKQIGLYYLTIHNPKVTWLIRIALVCGKLSAIGMSIVGNFTAFNMHMIGAGMALGFGAIYSLIDTYVSFMSYPHINTKLMAWFRLFLSTVLTIGFLTSCMCGPFGAQFVSALGNDTISIIAEWTTFLALDVYLVTHTGELKLISITAPQAMFKQTYEPINGDNGADDDDPRVALVP